MKKFMVIGLGNFGFQMAKTLYERGNEVVAVDKQRENVQEIKDFCTRAMIADAEDKEFLLSAGVAEMDAVVVSTGENISQSIIITLFLKEIGVNHVVAKANDPDHGRALEKIGADRIIFPEQEVAIKLAHQLSSPSLLNFLEFSHDYSMTELLAPLEFVGKSLAELDLRKKLQLFVVAIREAVPEKFNILPESDYRIKDSDVLILLGKTEDIAVLEKKSNETKE